MSKQHKIIWLIIAVVIIAGLAWILAQNRQTVTTGNKPIIFYSNSCPHCRNVEQYIAENNVASRYDFDQKEITTDQNNTALLIQKAKICGEDLNTLGVPLLFDNGKCYSGDKEIINYLATKN
jgi:glutaredoxin-related protein